MNESNSRKRLREWSIDELQEELQKRQRRIEEGKQRSKGFIAEEVASSDDGAVTFGPDASSVSLMVAIDKLNKLFEGLVGRCGNRYSYKNFVFPHEHAAFLLKTHPSIIGEAFRKRTVLSYFIQAKSPLDTVKEICEMYKNHLDNNQYKGQGVSYNFYRIPNPIGDACLYGPGAEGVLQYLVEEFPDQILQRDRQNRLPVELLLYRIIDEKPDNEFNHGGTVPRKVSYPTLEVLLSACPNMFQHCRNGSFYLSKLLDNYQVSHETKLVLFEKFAQTCDIDSIVVTKKAGTISVPEVMAVSKLLPSLKVCSILSKDIYDDASRVLNASLYSMDCSNLVELGMPLIPDYHPEKEDNGGKFLTLRAIRNCRNLKKLSLQVVGYERKKCDTCMTLCKDILRDNPGIESLDLRNFKLKNSATTSEFLSSMKNVKTLVMDNFRIDKRMWCLSSIPADSKLETFHLNADLKCPWVNGLVLQLLEEVPTMKVLKLSHCKLTGNSAMNNLVPDLTATLATALEKNCIEIFEVPTACTLDVDRICDALKSNYQLEELSMPGCSSLASPKLADTFEHHNTTVSHIEFGLPDEASNNPAPVQELEPFEIAVVDLASSDEDSIGAALMGGFDVVDRPPRHNRAEDPGQPAASQETQHVTKNILYYVMLNRFGRAIAQGAKTSTSELVDLLCEVANEPSFEVDLQMRHNIQMGLLLSAPNVWAGGK